MTLTVKIIPADVDFPFSPNSPKISRENCSPGVLFDYQAFVQLKVCLGLAASNWYDASATSAKFMSLRWDHVLATLSAQSGHVNSSLSIVSTSAFPKVFPLSVAWSVNVGSLICTPRTFPTVSDVPNPINKSFVTKRLPGPQSRKGDWLSSSRCYPSVQGRHRIFA